jgi:orotate phosphoribosyltransferase
MKKYDKTIAELLLQCRAIKLSPDKPFQWASGWKSPIYCDNRKTLAYPEIRNTIKVSFAGLIKEKFLSTQAIAGVATGAIAQGALVADMLELPFMYVRSEAKGHGLENLIEGEPKEGQKVVVIEDLVSTGGSSLKAVNALREKGCDVLGMVAIFTYGFPKAVEGFKQANCLLHTLSNYDDLVEVALQTGYISPEQMNTLKEWRKSPDTWKTGVAKANQETVFNYIADFRNFSQLIPPDRIDDIEVTENTVKFSLPGLGLVGLKLAGKEPSKKLIIDAIEGTAADFTFRVHIEPHTSDTSKVNLELDANLNMFIEMMAKNPLQQFLNIMIDKMETIEFKT